MADDAAPVPTTPPFAPVDSIDGVSLAELAERFGTPLYVYSHDRLVGNFRRIRDAFAGLNPLIAFSMKCNSNLALLKTLVGEGAGLDIVSAGELERGLRAGVSPEKVVFAGVGKTAAEIETALRAGIRMFNIESEAEAEAIAEVASRLGTRARAALRINPDVDASTHHYITTGRKENKFGIAFHVAREVFGRVAALPGMRLDAVHCHIGSQILKPDAFVEAVGRAIELIEVLRADGHEVRTLNLGGGFGIDYERGETPMDVADLGARIAPLVEPLGVDLIFEPGRSIAGSAGWLLTRVHYVKRGDAKNFAIVDGAMNDLLRPSLYSAFHRILPVGPAGAEGAAGESGRNDVVEMYDVVGPICESGDFLGKGREFVGLKRGDLLLVCDAGAYGMAMASNYNTRPRPAEVLIADGKAFQIRRRETYDDLLAPEIMEPEGLFD